MSINSDEVKRIVRFLLVGLFNTGLSYTVFVLSFYLLAEYFIALVISYSVALIVSFFLNRGFVFKSITGSIMGFVIVNMVSFVVNVFSLEYFVSSLLMSPYLSQAVCVVLVSLINYIGYSYVFR